jgi:peptidoglycan/LPS O-acetylase OafA/YrhL
VLLATVPALVFGLGWTYVQDGEITGPVRLAGVAALTQTYNLVQAFGSPDGRAFEQLWAVALAIQLAILALAMVAVSARFDRRQAARVAVAGAAGFAVLRLAVLALGFEAGGLERLPWFRLDGVMLGVGAGLLHTSVTVFERQRLYRATPWALVALVAAVVLSPERSAWSAPNLGIVVPIVAVATATIALAFGSRCVAPALGRVLSNRGLVWMGHRALDLYVWHWVIGVMLVGGGDAPWRGPGRFAAQIGLTLVAAFAAHEFVADPIRRRITRATP